MTYKNSLVITAFIVLILSFIAPAMATSTSPSFSEIQRRADERKARENAIKTQRELDILQRDSGASRAQDISPSPTEQLHQYEANERAKKQQYDAEQILKEKENNATIVDRAKSPPTSTPK